MNIYNIADEIAVRRLNAEELAYRCAYEAKFKEPASEDDHPADAYFFRALDEFYNGERTAPESTNSNTADEASSYKENIIFEREDAARELGQSILYHDEFRIWFAHDISACDLMGKDIEITLERFKPQFKDALDAQHIINLLDAALAKQPQIPDGLIGFFFPDAPPPLRRPQLKRARQWAKEQRHRFEEGFSQAQTLPDEDLGKAGSKRTAAELTIETCLTTSRFSRAQLDQLLLDIGLAEHSESGKVWAKAPQKAWQWASLRAALEGRLLFKHLSHAHAADVFRQAYGAKVSKGTMCFTPDLNGVNKKLLPNAFYSKLTGLLPGFSIAE